MGTVQGKLDFRIHNGVVQSSADNGITWVAVASASILSRAQALLPNAALAKLLGTDFESSAWFTVTNVSAGTSLLSKVDKGGVVISQTSATANSSSIVTPAGAPSWIDNARTSPWYFYSRFKLGTATDAVGNMAVAFGAISGAAPANPVFELGALGAVSATNFVWHLTNGAGANLATGTGPVLDTNWHTVEATNDGTTVTPLLDGAAFGLPFASTLIVAATPWMFYTAVANGATAANRILNVDEAWFACPPN